MIENPQTPAEWAEWRQEREESLLAVSAFLNRYARGCCRCGTTEARFYGAYTPRTHHFIATTGSPAQEMILTGNEPFARDLLDAMGAEVFCAKCARQVPKNGRWSAILEARMEEIMEKEILNGE